MAKHKARFVSGWHVKSIALLAALLFFTGIACADDTQIPAGVQSFIPPGMYIEDKKQGDLTGDGVDDLVLVLGDRKDNIDSSSTLLVLMRKSDGSFARIGSNDALLSLEGRDWGASGSWEILIRKGVLIADLRVGSRGGARGIWRFRFDPKERRMRLIGFDLDVFDIFEGGTRESTNYLTGKRIKETWVTTRVSENELGPPKVTSSRTTSVATPKMYLEQATPERLR